MRSTCLNPPRVFTQELRDAGITTAWPTKTDFNFEVVPDNLADTRDDWLETGQLPNGPFFAYRNFTMTHESSVWDTGGYDGQSYTERVAPLPASQRHDPADALVPPYLPDTPEVRRDIARYHDMLTLQDRAVGQALDLLDRSGQAERTVVIYLSDHGRGLPREKRWCYDAGLHLPLIIRWPGGIEPGTTDDQLVGWVDIAPTILSLMGVAIPDRYQGRAFLGDVTSPPRRYCYGGRDRMDECFDRVRVVRSKTHHYIRNFWPQIPYMQRGTYMEQGPSVQALRRARREGTLSPEQAPFMADTKPAEELYDAATDPDCLHNLADDPACRDTLTTLRSELDRFLETHHDLGAVSEEDLVARGILADDLERVYRPRTQPLPPEDRLGTGSPVLTATEAPPPAPEVFPRAVECVNERPPKSPPRTAGRE